MQANTPSCAESFLQIMSNVWTKSWLGSALHLPHQASQTCDGGEAEGKNLTFSTFVAEFGDENSLDPQKLKKFKISGLQISAQASNKPHCNMILMSLQFSSSNGQSNIWRQKMFNVTARQIIFQSQSKSVYIYLFKSFKTLE